ncbi:PilW family protein [Marinobacterium maritimum]|uniref:PilW family protein n=1 Tax=Marinobacterium maritimum TaxID=500162 RepID=A0ABN1I6Q1_9GAMM
MKEYQRRQAGFSLIELMIGLTIGLIILLGVVMVYISSIRSQTTSESLARVQESGRFASYFMAREVRQAGYIGSCPGNVNNLLNQGNGHYVDALFNLDSPIQGWANEAGDLSGHLPDYLRGDVLLIKHAARSSHLKATAGAGANAAAIPIEGDDSLVPQGSIILISDAYGCDLFQRANSGGNSNKGALSRGSGGTPGNIPPSTPWSHDYQDDVEINRLTAVVFYIGQGLRGQPALKQYFVNPAAGSKKTPLGRDTVLVEGVEDMRLRFGVDADGNGAVDAGVDAYLPADKVTDWSQVVTVQISVLARSPGNAQQGASQALNWPFDSDEDGTLDPVAAASDGSLRSVFSTTVAIRNRLP